MNIYEMICAAFIAACQGNTIISVTRPPTKIKQEREKRERERNRKKRGLAQWFQEITPMIVEILRD